MDRSDTEARIATLQAKTDSKVERLEAAKARAAVAYDPSSMDYRADLCLDIYALQAEIDGLKKELEA